MKMSLEKTLFFKRKTLYFSHIVLHLKSQKLLKNSIKQFLARLNMCKKVLTNSYGLNLKFHIC